VTSATGRRQATRGLRVSADKIRAGLLAGAGLRCHADQHARACRDHRAAQHQARHLPQ
jgi:hypothetical protein